MSRKSPFEYKNEFSVFFSIVLNDTSKGKPEKRKKKQRKEAIKLNATTNLKKEWNSFCFIETLDEIIVENEPNRMGQYFFVLFSLSTKPHSFEISLIYLTNASIYVSQFFHWRAWPSRKKKNLMRLNKFCRDSDTFIQADRHQSWCARLILDPSFLMCAFFVNDSKIDYKMYFVPYNNGSLSHLYFMHSAISFTV